MQVTINGEARAASLRVSLGQCSDADIKAVNQDFHGACIPRGLLLHNKGIALALADGISSSSVSQVASDTAVSSFLSDYYCTPESWSVKQSARSVLAATNAWLHAQTRRSQYSDDLNRGYVCTFSALVIKSTSAHVFHVGDARVLHRRAGHWDVLTEDHRITLGANQSYLSRALGVQAQLECDYHCVPVERGDLFLLATDGLYAFVTLAQVDEVVEAHAHDLDEAARALVDMALAAGSDDNLTVQLVRIDQLPLQHADELGACAQRLPCPPLLQARQSFDGYRLLRALQQSSRSHVWLAEDEASGAPVVLKVPSTESRDDPLALQRLLLEDWIARRLDNVHVLKAFSPTRPRHYLYSVCEYIDGQTLAQWMRDHPAPPLEKVRDLLEQMVRGVRAFHRQEMLHQDLRPDNILVDAHGTVKIIDFGAVRVAGLAETETPLYLQHRLGTAQYSAPEYFTGEPASERSDQFSLAVVAWQMLTGELPYGNAVSQVRRTRDLQTLHCTSLRARREDVPPWVEAALCKALHPQPHRRYASLSEFMHALRQPDAAWQRDTRPPLIERDPLAFWKGVSLLLVLLCLYLGGRLLAVAGMT